MKAVNARRLYGDNWLTTFENLDVPWRQLTLQEFLDYDSLFHSNKYSAAEIEDEIFSLAVLQPILIENIDILPAGVISTVVAHILQVSGPLNIDSLGNDLNIARSQVQDFMSSATVLICSVFPAYKPEDLFNLKYDVFMKRLAMAEKRLLELGVLGQPLSILSPTEQKSQARPSQVKTKELLEKKKREIESKLSDLNTSMPEGIISTKKIANSSFTYVPDLSSDPGDYMVNQKKIDDAKKEALSGLESIYPEYFKAMREGKKLTPEIIQSTKGRSPEDVKKKHEEYIAKVQSGEIIPQPPAPAKLDKSKVKVKRR